VKSYTLIVNPSSGRGRALLKAEALRSRLRDSTSVRVLQTKHRGAAAELASEAAQRVDRVIAIGGDGTLNEVLNGLMRSGLGPSDLPELGFLPAGTVNVAVRAFRLGSNPDSVATALVNAESIPLDVGMVRHEGGQRAFLLWFGAGWDAVIIHALNSKRSGLMGVTGLIGRAPQVLSAIFRYDQPQITSELDGTAFGAHHSVMIANVGPIAFGGMINHAADPGDGQFDVVGLPRATILRSIGLGFRMLVSDLTRSITVRHTQGSFVTLQADGDVPFQLDGEPVGVLPASVTLMHGAVHLLKT
jgi:diacylglycerol kinase (ATP)